VRFYYAYHLVHRQELLCYCKLAHHEKTSEDALLIAAMIFSLFRPGLFSRRALSVGA
jgi:hypothetical protein